MRARVLCVDPEHPDPGLIRQAAAVLRRGGFVAFPTETVYGLGANLQDPQAIQELYRIKRRPFEKQVTLHVADLKEVENQGVVISELTRKFMRKFWPGPLTLVLARGDGSTVGFRMPKHRVALALLKEASVPVVAPSANLSGKASPRTAQEVLADLADEIDLVLDAGATPGGVESTVLDLTGEVGRILRRGAIAEEVTQFLARPSG